MISPSRRHLAAERRYSAVHHAISLYRAAARARSTRFAYRAAAVACSARTARARAIVGSQLGVVASRLLMAGSYLAVSSYDGPNTMSDSSTANAGKRVPAG